MTSNKKRISSDKLSQQVILQRLKSELQFINQHYGVKKIGLFGSYARNEQHEDSDIDLLVEFEKPIGLKFFELSDYLEKCFGKKVDLLTKVGLDHIRIKQVAEGIQESVIYVA